MHGISIEAATIPDGWQERTVAVKDKRNTEGNTGHCLEAHDLAASKLAAGREKDRLFVTILLRENLVDSNQLIKRVKDLPMDESRVREVVSWIKATADEISESS